MRRGCGELPIPKAFANYVQTRLDRVVATLDRAFEIYGHWLSGMYEFYTARFPRAAGDSEAVYRSTIRAKALDTLRGLLPAATVSNVGIYATGQAYEQLLLRMRAHPLAEVRAYAALMLTELRKVIPAFLRRVDVPERGGVWSQYLAETREAIARVAEPMLNQRLLFDALADTPPDEVTLTEGRE